MSPGSRRSEFSASSSVPLQDRDGGILTHKLSYNPEPHREPATEARRMDGAMPVKRKSPQAARIVEVSHREGRAPFGSEILGNPRSRFVSRR
jgi:hypothetical protein